MRTTPLASHRVWRRIRQTLLRTMRERRRGLSTSYRSSHESPLFVALRARIKNSVLVAPSARKPTPGGPRSMPNGPAPTPRRSADHRSARPADRRKDRSSAAGHRTSTATPRHRHGRGSGDDDARGVVARGTRARHGSGPPAPGATLERRGGPPGGGTY